jgi:TolB-like protein/Tfp pilus assembly protein PilF
MSLFNELKRRNVFRVGIAYVVLGWLLLQVTDVVVPILELPEWVGKLVLFLLMIGFPVILVFAWAFELTPEGLKREKDVDRSQSITPSTGKKLDRAIIGIMAVVIAFLLLDRFYLSGSPPGEALPAAADSGTAKSIAVLPFADLSQDQDQRWFTDGLAEEILNALARTPDLLVASRTSSFKYRGSDLDISEIAAELGVAHVLEGSVRGSGDRIRVTAQLIRASDGFHVWSESYDRSEQDMIAIQEDLAVHIAEALETTLDPDALAAMASAGTRSVAAYRAYLRGLASRAAAEDMIANRLRSYEYFEEAREIDPDFAAAHFQAARFWEIQLRPTHLLSGLTERTRGEMMQAFRERIDAAVTTAPDEIERAAYSAELALVEMRLRDAVELARQYTRARPNSNEAWALLARAVVPAWDTEAAQDLLSASAERGYTEVLAATGRTNIAHLFIDPSDAADYAKQAVERWPTVRPLLYQAHRSLLWGGRVFEARAILDRMFIPGSDQEFQVLPRARQACAEGDRSVAEAALAELRQSPDPVLSTEWHLLMLLGREDEAVELVRPLDESGLPYQMASWLSYPQFDPRPYPNLMAVLEREGVRRPPPRELPFKCPPPEETSIAVLPFVNMSADAENEFFSDGVAEEILNVLARIPELKVAARTSAFAFKGSDRKISEIARELGVNHVLEGSVRKAGDQVRVTAQLIKADDGFHLWSETYDRKLDNIFAIQDEIAGAIAGELKVSLGLEAGEAGNLTGTRSIEAYEHYLQGMAQWHLRTVPSLEQSMAEFQKAVELDPDFAKAHAGLALTWGVFPGYAVTDDDEAYRKAIESANRALKLDPENVEALITLALVYRYQLDFVRANDLFQRAIELNPSLATAHQWYGGLLDAMGDVDASLQSYGRAWRLDPRSRIIGYNYAYRLDGAGRRAEAMSLIDEVLGFAPEFPDALSLKLHLALADGDCESAAETGNRLATALGKEVNSTPVYLDLCQEVSEEERKAAIDTITAWQPFDFASPGHPTLLYEFDFVTLLVELGELDAAFALLDGSNEQEQIESLIWIRSRQTENSRRFSCDPRFTAMGAGKDIPRPVKEVSCD